MAEYIEKEQALEAVTRNLSLYGDEWIAAYNIVGAIPPADVVDRAELCAKLMGEFNVVDIDEDDGECTLNDQWVSIIDVLDTIDGMRAEGTESIWGENGGGVNA